MTYLIYILMVPFYLIMLVSTYVLAPILGFLSVLFNIRKYPFPLNLFHTIDDDLDGGQHQLEWKIPSTKIGLGWQRTMWIWRNPAAGFNCIVLGLNVNKTKLTILVDNFPNDDTKQYRKSILENHGLKFFEFCKHFKMGPSHYMFVWIGWNYRNYVGYHQYKMGFHPWKKVGN